MATLILMVYLTNFVKYNWYTQKMLIIGILYQTILHILIIVSVNVGSEIVINGAIVCLNMYFIYVILNYNDF